MAGYAQRLRLRLFIEGVEVPVISAAIQVTPNAPAACSIQIPPLPEGTYLLPRSLVHLFFLDTYDIDSAFPALASLNNPQANTSPTLSQQVQGNGSQPGAQGQPYQGNPYSDTGDAPDTRDINYKLLFGGEVIGFQWTKSSSQRSLVLQCQDWSNYWDYAYQFNGGDLFGPGLKAMFSGGSTNLVTDFLDDESSAIIRTIQTPSIQYPNLKGLLGGIVHLLEAIGGSYYYNKQYAGQNIFFSLAELRLHITQMVCAYENDPTASRLLGAGYDGLFGRTLGNLGQQVSIRTAINALMGIIFHETYAQPCPSFVPGTGNTPSGQFRQSVRQSPDYSFVATTADNLLTAIQSVQALIAAAPEDVQNAVSNSRIQLLTSLSDMRATAKKTTNLITAPDIKAAKAFYAAASRDFDNAYAQALSWNTGATPQTIAKINAPLSDAATQLTKASDFTFSTQVQKPLPSRLNQHIFRPDVWFSSPPRCNVLFPEHYNTLTYSRQFLMEPTRLLLKTNDEFFGEDELFDAFYFAPKGFTLKTGSRELQSMLAGDILDHEIMTGILPVFEKMGELNIFAARSGTVNGKVPKIGLAQRSCNFLYFKYRFAARQLQVEGKFNPFVAPGFPGLVVDKYVDGARLLLREQLIQQNGGTANTDINKLLGTHFLANFTEIEHSVSQNAGVTRYNCSYARQPEESVEFLGAIRPDQTVQKRADQDATRVTVVAAIDAPSPGSLGPNGGIISAVTDVTQAYTGSSLPVYQGPQRPGTTQASLTVTIGQAKAASAYSAGVVSLVGSSTIIVQFRAYRITENVPRYALETVDLPAEEYIRPGWYGDIWHPSQIGQAYQSFFQTGSITDAQQASGVSSAASTGVTNQQWLDAFSEASKAVDADDPAGVAPGLLTLKLGASIQDAVYYLVAVYSYIRQNALDTDTFIQQYCWRPIATLIDMFGTEDLVFSQDGQTVVQGVEGLHSRAFGPWTDLFGLVTPDIEQITGIKRGSTVAQKADTRARKQAAVAAYVSILTSSRAVLG